MCDNLKYFDNPAPVWSQGCHIKELLLYYYKRSSVILHGDISTLIA